MTKKAASRLVNRALDAGVRFGPAHVEDLNMSINEETIRRVVAGMEGAFTDDQLQDLAGCFDDDVFLTMIKKKRQQQTFDRCHHGDIRNLQR